MTNVIAPQNQLFTSLSSSLSLSLSSLFSSLSLSLSLSHLSLSLSLSLFVNMMLNVNRNPKAYSRNGEKGMGVLCDGEEGEYIYLSLYCHHQNDSSIRWAAMRAILLFH